MIANYLTGKFDEKIKKYFDSDNIEKWEDKYEKETENINHDEPWLTLVACYTVFGNQQNYNCNNYAAINKILNLGAGNGKLFNFTSIDKIIVEKQLPEILSYRAWLKDLFTRNNFHLYPDRRATIAQKNQKVKASFEGNTNLDLLIEGISNGKKTACFIEAKFLSDISYQTTYNPLRDQIIRNIDAGIDYVENPKNEVTFENFHFFLLTPEIFKPKSFGCAKDDLKQSLGVDSSRLYCYKMEGYKKWENLKKALPHRQLDDNDWETLAQNIGWISFENMYRCSKEFNTSNPNEAAMIDDFFKERNLQ